MKKQKLKKILASGKGMTLLEVVVAMAILAVISVPILNVYVSSTRATMVSAELADAEFIAQVQLEQLINLGYSELISEPHGPTDFSNSAFNNKYDYTLELVPWGLDYSNIISGGETVSYMHVIPYQELVGGITQLNVMAFMPDGQVITAYNIYPTITLSEPTPGNYYFSVTNALTGAITSASGVIDTSKLAAVANTTMVKSSDKITFSFTPQAKVVFAMTALSKNYTFTGTYSGQLQEFMGTDSFLNFLVRATVKVYRAGDRLNPIAEMTDILYPPFTPG